MDGLPKEITDNYFSIEGAQAHTGKSRATIYNWLKNGLKSYNFYNKQLIHREDLTKYCKDKEAK